MTSRLYVGIVRRWEHFWFEAIPPDTLAFTRIAVGGVGLIGLLALVPVSTFWTPGGLIPVSGEGQFLRAQAASLGIGTIVGWGLFVGLILSFACMILGCATGWAVTCCFGGSVVQSFWNPLPLSGANEVLIVLLFCLLWADCGGRPSVDAWLEARTGGGTIPRLQSIMPIRLMRIQIALIYLNSGLWKLFGPSWRDGSTIHYVLNLNTYQRIPYSIPPNLEWLTTVATYGTLFWELSFVLMMFHRWTRRIALAGGIALHLGMFATLELGPFSWIMLAGYIAFLDPHSFSRFVRMRQQATGRIAAPRDPSHADQPALDRAV